MNESKLYISVPTKEVGLFLDFMSSARTPTARLGFYEQNDMKHSRPAQKTRTRKNDWFCLLDLKL